MKIGHLVLSCLCILYMDLPMDVHCHPPLAQCRLVTGECTMA